MAGRAERSLAGRKGVIGLLKWRRYGSDRAKCRRADAGWICNVSSKPIQLLCNVMARAGEAAPATVLVSEVGRQLDAEVVGSPVDDALLDGFRFEALGDGFVGEGGQFFVGGEAKGD